MSGPAGHDALPVLSANDERTLLQAGNHNHAGCTRKNRLWNTLIRHAFNLFDDCAMPWSDELRLLPGDLPQPRPEPLLPSSAAAAITAANRFISLPPVSSYRSRQNRATITTMDARRNGLHPHAESRDWPDATAWKKCGGCEQHERVPAVAAPLSQVCVADLLSMIFAVTATVLTFIYFGNLSFPIQEVHPPSTLRSISAVRFFTPALRIRRPRCDFTVPSSTPSAAAISRLGCPSTSRRST